MKCVCLCGSFSRVLGFLPVTIIVAGVCGNVFAVRSWPLSGFVWFWRNAKRETEAILAVP